MRRLLNDIARDDGSGGSPVECDLLGVLHPLITSRIAPGGCGSPGVVHVRPVHYRVVDGPRPRPLSSPCPILTPNRSAATGPLCMGWRGPASSRAERVMSDSETKPERGKSADLHVLVAAQSTAPKMRKRWMRIVPLLITLATTALAAVLGWARWHA